MNRRCYVTLQLISGATVLVALPAAAQSDAPSPGTVTVPTQGGEVVVQPGQTSTTQVYVPPPGYPAPGVDINPGLPSSSRPITDTSRSSDGFDLNQPSGGASVVTGGKGATAVLGAGGGGRAVSVPPIHLVRRGDTLWDLSAYYYGNPYQWPRVWSYNAHINNPHWIYPGDQVRMRKSGLGGERAGLGGGGTPREAGLINRRPLVPGNTVFLRTQGFIGDPKRDVWGELVGAREDQMLLSDGNNVYVTIREGVDVQPGQRLTIFRSVRQPEKVEGARKVPGEIVAIKGTMRVDQWDPRSRIARGKIVESVDVIERGALVGSVDRELDVVPPRTNQATMWARVLTSIYPHVYMGQNQVVFIDRGSADGLEPGNRLSVVRRGDSWRRSLVTSTAMARDRVLVDVPERVKVERTPLHGDERKFPEEIIGELRILRTERHSSIALVTVSHREIVVGDRCIARRGY
jgi:hypothetical protein